MFKNKKIAIWGRGKEGEALLKYCLNNGIQHIVLEGENVENISCGTESLTVCNNLMKIDGVYYTLIFDEAGTIIGYGIDGKVKLSIGKYATKERALEVLDEIFDRLECVEVTDKDTRKEAVIGTVKTYEMPEE